MAALVPVVLPTPFEQNIVDTPIDPGFVAGEWHNNHHLFSTSARNGFATDLTREDYTRVCRLLARTGTPQHTYEEYSKWGTVEKPFRTFVEFMLNWAFWYGAFFLMGGSYRLIDASLPAWPATGKPIQSL